MEVCPVNLCTSGNGPRDISPLNFHVPVAAERGEKMVHERMYWPAVLHTPMTFIGIPSDTLFRGISGDRFYHYYFDEHLNANGNRLFTRAITPALIQTYVQSAH